MCGVRKNLYQSTMELDELIRDFHTVIADGDPSTLKYLQTVLKERISHETAA